MKSSCATPAFLVLLTLFCSVGCSRRSGSTQAAADPTVENHASRPHSGSGVVAKDPVANEDPANEDPANESAAASVDETVAETRTTHTNRLANETSPYLLLHAHNPVDWYPWGPEALERARREKKVIFLSIGYSSCHWCHVMERESFLDEEIAAFMNEHFVCIKVDREERP
ncbi:MAG: DUF255 domain-containing protein, partial [Pirellulaceae bacterium]|nr:DUF255 domain-containing protein [Pirellulaceae bacterium]